MSGESFELMADMSRSITRLEDVRRIMESEDLYESQQLDAIAAILQVDRRSKYRSVAVEKEGAELA